MATYDIAVIGLGPAGCTAAYMFAASGLNVVAIEKGHEVYPLPRAVAMDGEIIRGFQRFGRIQGRILFRQNYGMLRQ